MHSSTLVASIAIGFGAGTKSYIITYVGLFRTSANVTILFVIIVLNVIKKPIFFTC